MKIIIDDPPIRQFGLRIYQGQLRYYYMIPNNPNAILVIQGDDHKGVLGKTGIALVSQKANGNIICELFPKAPARWQGKQLTQISIKLDATQLPPGKATPLSKALKIIHGGKK